MSKLTKEQAAEVKDMLAFYYPPHMPVGAINLDIRMATAYGTLLAMEPGIAERLTTLIQEASEKSTAASFIPADIYEELLEIDRQASDESFLTRAAEKLGVATTAARIGVYVGLRLLGAIEV